MEQEANRRLSALADQIAELEGEHQGLASHPEATVEGRWVHKLLLATAERLRTLQAEHAALRLGRDAMIVLGGN